MSAISAENPLAPIILLLAAAAPNQLTDDDNINNYNGIN